MQVATIVDLTFHGQLHIFGFRRVANMLGLWATLILAGATVPQAFFQAVLAIWPMSDQISIAKTATTSSFQTRKFALQIVYSTIRPASMIPSNSEIKIGKCILKLGF